MSDFDKNKDLRRKKIYPIQKEREYPRKNIFKYERDPRDDKSAEVKEKVTSQPTIVLQKREVSERPPSPKRATVATKEPEYHSVLTTNVQKPKQTAADLSALLWTTHVMEKSVKLVDETFSFCDYLQDYLQETSTDFLVVGVLGYQGVGKSTVMNLIAQNEFTNAFKEKLFGTKIQTETEGAQSDKYVENVSESLRGIDLNKEQSEDGNNEEDDGLIFKVQSLKQIEKGEHCTTGIDAFITNNRVLLLDAQPVLSLSVLNSEGGRASAAGEPVCIEHSAEVQSLQLAAFLLTVCHVLLLVQDWALDPNIIRFLLAAEMLKPPTLAGGEEELNEHCPQLIVVHTQATLQDMAPSGLRVLQDAYNRLLAGSKLRLTVHVVPFPDIDENDELAKLRCGTQNILNVAKKLRSRLLGAARAPLAPRTTLTERTWLVYAAKAWEAMRKSSFFLEFNKLLP